MQASGFYSLAYSARIDRDDDVNLLVSLTCKVALSSTYISAPRPLSLQDGSYFINIVTVLFYSLSLGWLGAYEYTNKTKTTTTETLPCCVDNNIGDRRRRP